MEGCRTDLPLDRQPGVPQRLRRSPFGASSNQTQRITAYSAASVAGNARDFPRLGSRTSRLVEVRSAPAAQGEKQESFLLTENQSKARQGAEAWGPRLSLANGTRSKARIKPEADLRERQRAFLPDGVLAGTQGDPTHSRWQPRCESPRRALGEALEQEAGDRRSRPMCICRVAIL